MKPSIERIREAIEYYETRRNGRTCIKVVESHEILEEIRNKLGFWLNNNHRSRLEIAKFKADKPIHYFAYHNASPFYADPITRLHYGDHIQNWMSDQLGTVVWSGDPYHCNMGDIRQNFRCQAINGLTYSGTAYLSAGDYVRMRAIKTKVGS
jgi:hypothetical protein